MTLMLKRGLTVACVTVAALSIPTPALAADSGGVKAGASRVQTAGICDLVPQFWWCKK
jgi:hypothetical protein